MTSLRLPLLAALFLALLSPLALAADDAAQFRLTSGLLDRIDAIQAEGERLGRDDEEEDESADNPDDTDAFVRRIESDPRSRELLARHGVTVREFALAAQALLHAGAYLAFEGAMDKQAKERLLVGYTPTQRANIELLRQRIAAGK